MRFLLILIFTISLSTSSYGNWLKDMFKSTVTSQELIERDKKYYTKEDSELFTGKVEDKHKNGKTSFVGQYKNGMRSGEFITYFENGQIQKKETYLLGTQEGKVEEFNDDGSLRTSYVMKDGKYPDGPIKFLDKEGFVEDFIFYKNNKEITEDFKTEQLHYKNNIKFNSDIFILPFGNVKSLFNSWGVLVDDMKIFTIYDKDGNVFTGDYFEIHKYEDFYGRSGSHLYVKLFVPVQNGYMNGNVSVINGNNIKLKFQTSKGKLEGKFQNNFFCPPGKVSDIENNYDNRLKVICLEYGIKGHTVHPWYKLNYTNNKIDLSKKLIHYVGVEIHEPTFFKLDEEENNKKLEKYRTKKLLYQEFKYNEGEFDGVVTTYFKNGDIKKELYENGTNKGEVK